jgi:hypothetical protein
MSIDQGCTAGAAADLASDLAARRPLARALPSPAAWASHWANSALNGAILRLASQLRHGHLTLTLPDGSTHRFRGYEPGPEAEIRVHRPAALRRLVLGGHIGFAESYIDGHWDTADLPALMALAATSTRWFPYCTALLP